MPPEQNPTPKPSADLKRLRTYQSDVEEMMQKQQTSKAAIAIAQDKKRVGEEAEPKPAASGFTASKIFSMSGKLPLGTQWNFKLIGVVVLGLLVIIGIGVGAFFFWPSGTPKKIEQKRVEVPKITAVALQGGERRAGVLGAIQDTVDAAAVPANEIRTIPVTRDGQSLSTTDFLAALEAGAPPALVRALGPTPVLGVYGSGQTFLLLSVVSYDHAFSGMLSWEQNLVEDMGPLFGVSAREVLDEVGSTTTEALQSIITIKDAIIRNKDVRAAFDPEGKIVFMYSFVDKQTLVMTASEDTLKMLVSKAGGGRLK